MKIADVRERAFAMPLTVPCPPQRSLPLRQSRISHHHYRTDKEALEAVSRGAADLDEPIVKYEFIRMPDLTGFGDYTESGQVIPVKFNGVEGGYTHAMYLNDGPPIYGGRELWGFPKKFAQPVARSGQGHVRRHARLRLCAGRDGDDGLQAPSPRSQGGRQIAGATQLPPQDHSMRGRQPAHSRNSSTTGSRMWCSRAPGPVLRRSTSDRTLWRRSRLCPCAR